HRGGERLALPGLHLGDAALVQGDGADDLNVEVALADGAPRGLADARERLRKDVVQAPAAMSLGPELVALGPQLGVGQVLDLRLVRVDQAGDLLELLDLATFTDLTDLLDDQGGSLRGVRGFTLDCNRPVWERP